MKPQPIAQELTFVSKLERIAEDIDYFAVPVPAATTRTLRTKAAVAVVAEINGSKPFLVSLYTRGEGRHGMRVKAEVRKEVQLKEGDRVRVKIGVIDRAAPIELPADLEQALRAEKLLKAFQATTPGKLRYTLRVIDQAARPETRAKRIQEAVNEVRLRNGTE